MKKLLAIVGLLLVFSSFAQGSDSLDRQLNKTPKKASFVTKVDIKHATKDGIYMNGYVVNLGYEKAKTLDGKTVRVRGRVTIVKGIGEFKEGEARQGRMGDTKYIKSPKIEIISDGDR